MALLMSVAPALADDGVIHDRAGDLRANPPGPNARWDLARAAWSHDFGGRLIHKVSVRGRIGNPSRGTGPLPELRLRVKSARRSRSRCRISIDPSAGNVKVESSGCRAAKLRRGVSVERVSSHTLKYAFTEDALGDPRAYRWSFVSASGNCARCAYDRLPNHGPERHGLGSNPNSGPIQHVVIIYQENHSFDNVLGRLCAQTGTCDGATEGTLPDGSTIALRRSPDIVPKADHQTQAQNRAIDGGRMDGFGAIGGCRAEEYYACYTQFTQDQIPNLWNLATSFAISDRTFQLDSVPSYGAHIELVSTTLDGFTGDRPPDGQRPAAPGWGCDSQLDAPWQATPGGPISLQPACVPWNGLDPAQYPYGGAYRPTRVRPAATIMDRLDRAGLSWKLYAQGPGTGGGYLWAICPNYAKCLYTQRHQNQVDRTQVLGDARTGRLPNFSVVLPSVAVSQHNSDSMTAGDNWIGNVVSRIENGPDWDSTAIFILYDDCGCFYDHVPPPPGLGIRTPMVIVSPWVRPGFVDSNQASIASMLAFTEHNFGLEPLGTRDGLAYDYRQSFDFSQTPLAPTPMTHSKLSPHQRWVVRHPQDPRGS